LTSSDHRTLVVWATECAAHVLPYFEENYPNDNRPRKALEAGRAWVRGEVAVSEALAAHAARDADGGAARAAVRATPVTPPPPPTLAFTLCMLPTKP
jgi:hypothetical protein